MSRIPKIASIDFRVCMAQLTSGLCRDHTTGDAPPSMLIAVPVVKPARSEQRKHAIAANSSALPMRPKGILAAIFAVNSS